MPNKRSRIVLEKLLVVALLLPLRLSLLVACGRSQETCKLDPPKPPHKVKLSVVPEGLEVSWDRISEATHYTVFWGTENGKYNRFCVALKTLFYVPRQTWANSGD